jgi:hypothetical protein
MDELGGLHLLELGFAFGLRIVADDHLDRQPCGDHTKRVNAGLSQPCPSGLCPLLWRQSSQSERLYMRP